MLRRACWLLPLFGLLPAVAEVPKEKELVNALGMKLVRLEPGIFQMGQDDPLPKGRAEWDQWRRDWDEAPAHTVKISQAFYLGTHEVTNAQYEQFDPDHKKWRGFKGISKGDQDPVVWVSWPQAVAFCDWLSRREGKPYRLPTEAEWEYACRAGTRSLYHTGDTLTPQQANFGLAADGKTRSTTRPVGSYPPNAWGLYDMHGNVAEWVHDWYGPYAAGDQTDPVGRAEGIARVCRGWSYASASHKLGPARYARSANRSGNLPEDANRRVGFRVALGARPMGQPLPAWLPPFQQNIKQGPAPKAGPDPSQPYFRDFVKEKQAPLVPKDLWGPVYSTWNHYGACCVCPNGDVLAVWYTTVAESGPECSQAISRLRAGAEQWDTPSAFLTVPDTNTHAPVLFCDGRRIYHFATQSFAGWDNAANIMRTSDDNGLTWTKPRLILERDAPQVLSQPCSALRTGDGKLVLACDGDGHRDERVLVSTDGGQTWRVGKGDMRQACGGKYAIHPAIVQRADGALLAFLRGPHPMPLLVSKDLGDSWEHQDSPFPGISVGQKPSALKLASGALLLCSLDNKKELVGGGLFAALSLDDGKTWAHVRKVEGLFGYTALAQAPNGVIYLCGPSGARNPPAVVAFNEAWLKEGKPLPARQ